ncbi:GNAT family N-acetyltransferase [Paenibacillus sp. GSMTC-2017]|uniref:GNAT family N-acetyltransferase n=1 Tax=Paenibacillus sp. GSMTC-2017 TaxID=2794350 RepID=UPI001E31E1D0|nr:GNAT family N-acetyltransferase [Paenibacillus sp. GSMTC-2017]
MAGRAIIIRNAEESDLERVKAVLLDAYAQYEFLYPKEKWEQYKENIEASVTNPKVKARIIAELKGEIVGSVFLYDSSEAAYGAPELNINTPIMRLLAVKRSVRGLGVATELIRASANWSLDWGADTLHLHTSDVMSSAIKLYERLGFERAIDKDIVKEESVVISYRLHLRKSSLLQAR